MLVTTGRASITTLPIYREWKSTPVVVQCIAVNIKFLFTIFKKCAENISLWHDDT